MDLRLLIALWLGKVVAKLIQFAGGGATAAPGLFALKIDPNLVNKLSSQIKHGSTVICGTNGKTTTARISSSALGTKFAIIHNRQGSNLLRGIASTLISKSSFQGKIKENLGIWEIDEATLPDAIKNLQPLAIVLLNLFRDQLDRYGEVDTVRTKWQQALSKLTPKTVLILNADDPGISFLAKSFKGKAVYFGISDTKVELPTVESVADIKYCLNCNHKLNYSALLSAHIGHYKCSSCGFKRPLPQISASQLKFHSDFTTSLKLTVNHQHSTVNSTVPGLYNTYNILAAAAVADVFGVKIATIKHSVESFSTAFGRFQQVKIKGKNIVILLIKNPAGANEVLRTIAVKDKLNILSILNDNIADGRDVSWIWDTNWETLAPKTAHLAISGTRAWDLATRLKYAGFNLSKNNTYKDINYSLTKSLETLHNKDTLFILPTYTAMLEIQNIFSKMGVVSKWQSQ